ncbi:MAG: T9SS type A sorting domain-containing protein [Calditrichaeota bacterium]|nr:T9SS type A sorting domain-containing protein [Calditrichota bacterium]MCB9089602.1 T9SS type A sorting domain-containing protein [Calditrichia bacterium]MCB0292555.1 T9SS type A sorting domain-containing protein [Calditrichota bacterium]MCB0298355.1 T9SS type A sorting domain-containing protein [Calditrichota bacterium]MCB0303595.1 T9SS type A sorting domain-containing protein [Calditrichota bacterium]
MFKKCIITAITVALMFSAAAAQTGGRIETHTFYSQTLEVTKNYIVYLPEGYDSSTARYPSVYFLRLHENEWFNNSLPGRNGSSLKHVLDTLITNGVIGKMIIVGPSTGSNNGLVSGAVNMLSPNLTTATGIGTGKFEDYLIHDLITHIDATYRTIPDPAHRGVDGFSLGGYSSTVISFRNPGIFRSVGSYDGTIMWYNLDDPGISGNDPDDPIWMSAQYNGIIGPLFGIPRDVGYMLQHSAINVLVEASPSRLDSIRAMKFHIHAGASTAVTNLLRNIQLLDSMAAKGIYNSFENVVLAPNAIHDYGFADLHASLSLVKHWEVLQPPASIEERPVHLPLAGELHQNYPNPFNPSTVIGYRLEKAGDVQLSIYNLLGQHVINLVAARQPAGRYRVEWNGKDAHGRPVPSGIYFYRLTAGELSQTRRMLLLR